MFRYSIASIGEILWDVYPDYKRLGGAPFNFLYHIKQLTGRGSFYSRIGNDEKGREILEFLRERSFDIKKIKIDTEHPTGEVKVKLSDEKVPEFIIKENRAYDFILLSIDERKELIKNHDLLYFGTLAQRNKVTRDTLQSLWNEDLIYFCDINLRQDYYTAGLLENVLKHCNVIKINSEELDIVAAEVLDFKGGSEEAAKKVREEFELDLLCVTMGGSGAVLYDKERAVKAKSDTDEIVDTVGAGDAYAAMLCIGYLSGWDIRKTAQLAADFAADICTVSGAIPDDKNFYKKYLESINE